jgi:phospholipid N-methyltransferase
MSVELFEDTATFAEGGTVSNSVLTDSKSKTELLFDKDSHIDNKNITNKSEKVIPDGIIDEISNKGITSERLDKIGVPVFKYRTQITIHGTFNESVLKRNYLASGYKNLFINKNGSLGVKYNGVDEEKKQKVSKAIYLAKRLGAKTFTFNQDSKGCELSKIFRVSSKEEGFNKKKELQDELIKITEFIGSSYVYFISHPFFGLLVASVIHLNAIYEKDLWKFIEKTTSGEIKSKNDYNTKYDKYIQDEKAKNEERDKEYKAEAERKLAEYLPKKELLEKQSTFNKVNNFKVEDKIAYAIISKNYDNEPEITVYYINKIRGRVYYFKRNVKTWGEITSNYEPKYTEKRSLLQEFLIKNFTKTAQEKGIYLIDINGILQNTRKPELNLSTDEPTGASPDTDLQNIIEGFQTLLTLANTTTEKNELQDIIDGFEALRDIEKFSEGGIIDPTELQTKIAERIRQKQHGKELKDTSVVSYTRKYGRAVDIITANDLEDIEKDNVTAYKLIEKNKIWPKYNIEEEKQAGVQSGLVYFKIKLREALGNKPIDNPIARRIYVDAITELREQVQNIDFFKIKAYLSDFYDKYAIRATKEIYLTGRKFSYIADDYKDHKTFENIFSTRFYNFILFKTDSAKKIFIEAHLYNPFTEELRQKAVEIKQKQIQENIERNGKTLQKIKNSTTFQDIKEAVYTSFIDINYKSDFETEKQRIAAIYERRINGLNESYQNPTLSEIYNVRTESWSWANKETGTGTAEDQPKDETSFDTIFEQYGIDKKKLKPTPLSYIKRTGGLEIPGITVESIQKHFGYKDVVFGNYVNNAEGREHARHFLSAMLDLAETMNVDIKQINQLGGLSIAFGAMGCGPKGLACYYPDRKVINLTKRNGDGSLAHEWGHYFDNVLAEGDEKINLYKFASDSELTYKDNYKVAAKIKAIANYIKYGEGKEIIIKEKIRRFSNPDHPKFRVYGSTLQESIELVRKKFPMYEDYFRVKTDKQVYNYYKYLATHYGLEEIEVEFVSEHSNYYTVSSRYDQGSSKRYWSSMVELFARAFETCMEYKLHKSGKTSNYLVSVYNNMGVLATMIPESLRPYPYGKELEDLTNLFDELVKTIKQEYQIGDFTWINSNRTDEYIELAPVKETEAEEVESGVIVPEDPTEPVQVIDENANIEEKEQLPVSKDEPTGASQKEPWEMTKSEFIQENELKQPLNNKSDKPTENIYKEGDLFIEFGNDPYVFELKFINPNSIDYSEKWQDENAILLRDDIQQYIKWFKEGKIPLPITVVFNKQDKKFVSVNRRRLLAARAAKVKTIPAWVEIGKHSDLIKQAISENKPVPPEVLAYYPELQVSKDEPTGASQKQPWEMTLKEYLIPYQKEWENYTSTLNAWKRESEASKKRGEKASDGLKRAKLNHVLKVKQALSENKPIPQEVLKDYPELKVSKDEPTGASHEQQPDFLIYNIPIHKEVISKLHDGKLSVDEYKAAFKALLANKRPIIDWLGTHKKDDLLRMLGMMRGYRYKSEKKDDVVKAVYDEMMQDFALDSISYSMGQKYEDVLQSHVESKTQEDLDHYAQKIAELREKYKAKKEQQQKALENPETLDEFNAFIKEKGLGALSSEQKIRYDNLVSESIIEKRKAEQEQKATIQAVELGDTTMEIIETIHTRDKYPLFVVKLSDRVSKEQYNELLAKAKRLGGWYSSFRGNGAIPGFQFKEREQAEKFAGLKEGSVSNLDKVEERTEIKTENKVSKLRENANKMIEEADEEINRERLTNTYKRATQAGHADNQAREKKRIAQTMLNIADAIESGEAKLLNGINAKTHIELLDSLVRDAKRLENNEKFKDLSYQERENLKAEPATIETIDYLTYGFYPKIYGQKLKEIVLKALHNSGVKRIAARWEKLVNGLKEQDDFQVKNDEQMQMIIDMFNSLPESDKKYNYVANQIANHKRLKSMGIENDSMLRAMLREYVQYRGKKQEADKVKELERNLAGRKNIGFDFFPTPKSEAENMVDIANISEGMDVLEPSAGNGNIADAIKETGINPDVIEIASSLREILQAKGHNLVDNDFLAYTGKKYDRIIMNPPFGHGAEALDIDHVKHAYSLLKPGGRIVAIMGAGTFFRTDKKAVEFREWLDSIGAEYEKLPDNTFADKTLMSTTGVAAYRVVIDNTISRDEPSGASQNQLTGGKADNLTIEQIAEKHHKNLMWMRQQLETGINTEKEHTSDIQQATEIAMDHLAERPDYYIQLADMEQKPILEVGKDEPQGASNLQELSSIIEGFRTLLDLAETNTEKQELNDIIDGFLALMDIE